jgi:TonB-dependent starch-binding outer membrane protein SusC
MKKTVYKLSSCGMLIAFLSAWQLPGQAQVVAYEAHAQQVKERTSVAATLSIKNALNNLRNYYKVDILFSDQLVKNHSVPANTINLNQTLEENLDAILKSSQLSFKKSKDGSYLITRQVQEKKQAQAQPQPAGPAGLETQQAADRLAVRTITGKVVSEKGEGLPGVSILLKGTTTGASTDPDGSYALTVPDNGGVLVFSFIGFITKEVAIPQSGVLHVTLSEDTKALEEVVVVGYGTQKRSDVTGAVSNVSGTAMQNNAVASVAQTLQGKIAGLQVRQTNGGPGADAEIRIRGLGTFGANAFPLVVIDGIITSGGLSDIDPSNIEDITVLKDASSAAIYGSRGANGVVLVTTKRGKAGKEVINFQTYYSLDNVTRKIPTVNATTYAEMVNDFYTNQGIAAPYADPASQGQGTNWQDEIFRTGGKQNYALSMSGGTEKHQHALTMSYYRGTGIVVNSKYSRANLRMNNDFKPLEHLKVGSSIGLTYGRGQNGNPQEAIDRALIYAPNVRPYKEDGSYGIADRAGQPTTMTQPLVAAYERDFSQNTIRGLGNLYAEYEILDGLKFKTSLGLEYNNFDQNLFTPSYNFGLGNSNGTAVLARNTNNTKNWMVDNILSYSKTFNNIHNIDLMAGYTFQKERYEYFNARRTDFSRNTENLQVLDAGTANDQARGSYSEWALQSYLGRFNYSYKGKYLFTTNLRIDQSSRFAQNNRTGIFPSFSAGWILSEENFLRDKLGPISYLKLRGGYGVLGNQAIGNYPYQSVINSSIFYVLGGSQNVVPGAAPTNLANPIIQWEKTSTTGAGLEVNFFQNKLQFMADYYNRNTSDILVVVPLPTLSGLVGNPYQNVASVRNSGFEFTVDYKNVTNNKNLSYNVGINLSVNSNEVTKLNKGLAIINAGGGQGGVETRTTYGQAINSFFGYVQEGVFQTQEEITNSATQPNAQPGDIKFKDLDANGVINANDRTFIGSTLAKQIVGLNAGIKYKNFDISVVVSGDFGRDQGIFAPGFAAARAAESTNAMWAGRWTGPGTSNKVPRIVGGDPNNNSRSSTFWIRSQDYLRIQNLQLGYDFSGSMLSKSGLSQLRLYVAAQNLATFTNYPGYDPELSATAYPLSRSIFFGVNLGL